MLLLKLEKDFHLLIVDLCLHIYTNMFEFLKVFPFFFIEGCCGSCAFILFWIFQCLNIVYK